ncbi:MULTISPECIES: zinc ribbon domain-containing protein [unclassified Oceanobacter]|uniref:zinc ribbon domain-containing protein n=1 Tax=unclassified Oceanobacter TaxID=2620260 RepID=UPI0026E24040|nr:MULTISPECIES: zinc ribbon domain-containing protein [unclassified Oceanobacter]MDO6682371.1 zinc ribbon domain-containing protein [Oceanobacter sp. 5_MG-2023]MDP2505993.1 zinc ribbon domain-containing protein [Oceanobacter sp. 3_MG-2023]MDP2547572.1 zinc ribbon domain-containing protein [Oceanobacter sp. 4_MG-2023]MDP2608946.1 zinc ribbon domain-containing protein [Oceanobacter sp. 1_MG-2023]MDP2612069.1 zinc ribbon domain-containing protein [Oceanobacter sp. 2_MG-2023]
MPMYDYKCPHHGVFQELAPMQEHDQPQPCPQCHTRSARVIVLPPAIAKVLKETRAAMERNEKSREAPDVMSASQYQEKEHEKKQQHLFDNRHKHDKGCGCGSKRKSNLMYTANGEKMFPGMRPWMISH